jgi:hypothetical protein
VVIGFVGFIEFVGLVGCAMLAEEVQVGPEAQGGIVLEEIFENGFDDCEIGGIPQAVEQAVAEREIGGQVGRIAPIAPQSALEVEIVL